MTDRQFHILMNVLGIQLGITFGCFFALLVIIYHIGRKRL